MNKCKFELQRAKKETVMTFTKGGLQGLTSAMFASKKPCSTHVSLPSLHEMRQCDYCHTHVSPQKLSLILLTQLLLRMTLPPVPSHVLF
jgi:hypothetical protein